MGAGDRRDKRRFIRIARRSGIGSFHKAAARVGRRGKLYGENRLVLECSCQMSTGTSGKQVEITRGHNAAAVASQAFRKRDERR